MMRSLALPVIMALACKSEPPCTPGTEKVDDKCVEVSPDTGEDASGRDADEDGYETPDDCDDADPSVHPDAKEFCDGIDNDCDGTTDEGDAVNAQTFFADEDGDGFGNPDLTVESCELEDGMSEDNTDCDDTADSAYPGATEVWYDGIDNDCLGGSDDDADGDGESGGPDGSDCDDTDPEVNTSAEEVCGDGTDNNCDGDLGECGRMGDLVDADAEGRLFAEKHDTWAGAALTMASDLTGDGQADLVIGAPRGDLTAANSGSTYVVPGPIAGVTMVDEVAYIITGVGIGDQAGTQVLSSGDLDGDGHNDLLVTAPGAGTISDAGAVYMVPGPISGNILLSTAPGWIVGDEEDLQIGHAVAIIGDQDGDTVPEVLIGAPEDGEAGSAWLVSGPVFLEREVSEGHQISGLVSGDGLGTSVTSLGDVNGDGIDDLALGAPGADNSTPSGEVFENSGTVYVFHGPVLRDLAATDADTTLRGAVTAEHAGTMLAGLGDMDGDGQADIAIGAPGANDEAGRIYVVSGSATGTTPLGLATARVDGTTVGARLGNVLEPGGDADNDGLQDLLFGLPGLSANTGQAGIFYGPIVGTVTTLDADLMITGSSTGHRLGASVAGGQDIDRDGTQDILIGVPGEDTTADSAGAALVFFGSGS